MSLGIQQQDYQAASARTVERIRRGLVRMQTSEKKIASSERLMRESRVRIGGLQKRRGPVSDGFETTKIDNLAEEHCKKISQAIIDHNAPLGKLAFLVKRLRKGQPDETYQFLLVRFPV